MRQDHLLLLLLAGVAMTGCSLKGLMAKGDDGGAAAPGADSGTTATAADAAPAAAAPAAAAVPVNDAGPVAKNAATAAATAKTKSALTCAKGQLMGTEALSPFSPFCGAPCKTNADCKGGLACTDVNALAPDGTIAKSGPPFIKLCMPGTTAAPTTGKAGAASSSAPSAATATAAAAAAPKCGPNQHFDDINKKCRAFGDCPKGFHWNDPMKTCLADD